MINKMAIKISIHQKNIVAFIFSSFNKSILYILIGSVEINKLTFFICLIRFNDLCILLEREIFVVGIFKQSNFSCSIVKLLFREHSILDEEFQIIPLLFKYFTIGLKNFI